MNSAFRIVLLAVVVMAGTALKAGDEEGENDRLQNLKEELDLKRAEYDKLGEKEQDQLTRLRKLEEQIALSGQLILKIERTIADLNREMATGRIELAEANSTLAEKKHLLMERLRYIYKAGNIPGWTELLLSKDPTDVLSALKNMKTLVDYDRHLVESYNRFSNDVSTKITRLDRDRNTLDALRNDYQDELMRRKITLDSRRRLVEKLRKDKAVVSESLERLEEDTRSIAGIFDRLQATGIPDSLIRNLPGLEGKKGDMIWPAYGSIVRPFGTHKDKRGIKLTNPGIDIKAPYGSRVSAAAPGIVIYSSWLRGYGQFLIISHGDEFYTLYANLGSVMAETGDVVNAGQAIGLVGDSGTLEGSRLHFELRHGKEQLNPVDWLR